MAFFDSWADSDVRFFSEGSAQPPGESVLLLWSWYRSDIASILAAFAYDWSRIQAVLVDEPYWVATGGWDWSHPCAYVADPRLPVMRATRDQLRRTSSALAQLAPRTRFWINFSEPEIQWMQSAICPSRAIYMNDAYIDVISMDKYNVAMPTGYYDWIWSHRATPAQQMALVPGTFSGRKANWLQALGMYLWSYFDFAERWNGSCGLPVGRVGVTGRSDGCPVWLVVGWPFKGSGPDYVGAALSPSILDTWRATASQRHGDNLLGWIDVASVQASGTSLEVSGWAMDRSRPSGPSGAGSPPWVSVRVDGGPSHYTRAGGTWRPDVTALFGIDGGWRITAPAPTACGVHTVSATVSSPTSLADGYAIGMAAHLKLDESAGTAIRDSSPSANAAYLVGPVAWLDDALEFNGRGDGSPTYDNYAWLANSPSLENVQEGNYTLAAFVRVRSKPPCTSRENCGYWILGKTDWLGLFYTDSQRFAMSHHAGGARAYTASGVVPAPGPGEQGRWHHVAGAVSRAAGTVKLYVDGALAGSVSFPPGASAAEYGQSPWRLGSIQGWFGEYQMDGAIHDARIYDRELVGEEIAALAQLRWVGEESLALGGATSLVVQAPSCTCPPGLSPCGGACVDLLSDQYNCGACGSTCQELWICVAGSCWYTSPPG